MEKTNNVRWQKHQNNNNNKRWGKANISQSQQITASSILGSLPSHFHGVLPDQMIHLQGALVRFAVAVGAAEWMAKTANLSSQSASWVVP